MSSSPGFDPYAVLQVVPSAEQEVVHAAFKALALKYHPDHDSTRRAAAKMADLNRAYAILRDERSREAHDRAQRRVVAGELDLSLWPEESSEPFVIPSLLPPVVFDLAFDLPADAPGGRVLEAISASAGPHLERQEVFDVFSGAPLPEGRKSLAVRLTFRHPERTMTNEEMVPVRAAIVAAVSDRVGGILRGG